MIYINSNLSLEELSELYKKSKRRVKKEPDYEKQKAYHRDWAKSNKEHLSAYRKANREKIREQYNAFLRKNREQCEEIR